MCLSMLSVSTFIFLYMCLTVSIRHVVFLSLSMCMSMSMSKSMFKGISMMTDFSRVFCFST